MYDDRSNSARRGPLATFAAAFAGVFLLGGVVLGVEFFELHRKTIEAPPAPRPAADQRLALDSKFRQSRDRVGDARKRADAAEMAVFQFLNGWFVDASQQPTAEPPPKPVEPQAVPASRPNPEWVELNRQITEMQQHRAELLVKLTPAHPTVQALDSQIAKTRDLLAGMPAASPIEANAIPVEPPAEHNANPQSTIHPPSAETLLNYRNLLLSAGQARESYRSALAAENTEWKASRRGGEPVIALDHSGVIDLRGSEQNLAVVAASNRPFPIGAVAVLTLLSLFAGALAARKAGRRTSTFMSAAEIEATLGLPVLGRIGPESSRQSKDAA